MVIPILDKKMIRLTDNQSTSLETLRGLSAIIVVIAHAFQIFISGYYPSVYFYFGMTAQLSVVVFFILSGILIGVSIQNNKFSNNGKFNVLAYSKSRILRIYPPLVLSLIITACLSAAVVYLFGITSGYKSPHKFLLNYSFLFDSKEYISTLTFTNMFTYRHVASNGALWSLPLEVWFYVIAGVAMLKSKLSTGLSIFMFFILSESNPKFLSYASLWAFSFFASYVVFSASWAKIYALSIMSLLISLAYYFMYIVEPSPSYKSVYSYMVMAFIAMPLIFLIIKKDIRITILNQFAASSYTLYLIHFPILFFFSFLTWFYGANGQKMHIALFIAGPIVTIAIAYKVGQSSENKNFVLKSLGLK